jgi:hypothetical protein
MKKLSLLLSLMVCFGFALEAQNVGIGTTTPAMALHVSKATDTTLLLLENRTTLNTGTNTGLYFKNGSYYTGAVKSIGTGTNVSRLSFFTFADGSPNSLRERLSIVDGGNVGVGITTPTATLHVNGTMRLEGNGAAAGKVLTSDANGNASWQTSGTGNGVGFSAYLSASLPLADGVTTDVTGYTEDFDDGNVFTPANGRFTAPSAGVYQIFYNLNFLESGTAIKYLNIDVKVNGGTTNTFYYVVQGLNSNAGATYTNSLILKLAQGDFISLSVTRSQSGGSTLRGGSFTGSTYFSAHKVY